MELEGTDVTPGQRASKEETSQIRDFYENETVLITGGLGFIGRLTVEKILRSCPRVSRLYLIARPKKGKTSEERLYELFNNILFEKLQHQNPNFRTKVTLVNGDLEKENLGVSDEDRQMLINEVNIVLHIAATVRFDEKLRKAANINVRAVRDIFLMAKEMQNLKSIVHVSTAYSHCTKKEVDEVFYDTPITGDKLLDLINLVDDEYLANLTPSLVGKWPNTYTFTKAIAELTVRELGQGLPASIVRPSIVISTLKEPLVGWINNYYGVIGVSCAAGLGLLHTLYCDASMLIDMVPADFTVNIILAASWAMGRAPSETHKEKINNVAFDELSVEDDVPIFNFVCSPERPITWQNYSDFTIPASKKYPSVQAKWYVSGYLMKHLIVHKILDFFLHLIPAYIIDALLYITGKKPIAVDGYNKAVKLYNAIKYFMKRQWAFKNNNVLTLWKKLGKTDQRDFEFSMTHLNWATDIPNLVKAARIYLLKDPFDTLPQARKRYVKLKVVHYTVVYFFYFGLAYLSWKIFSVCLL